MEIFCRRVDIPTPKIYEFMRLASESFHDMSHCRLEWTSRKFRRFIHARLAHGKVLGNCWVTFGDFSGLHPNPEQKNPSFYDQSIRVFSTTGYVTSYIFFSQKHASNCTSNIFKLILIQTLSITNPLEMNRQQPSQITPNHKLTANTCIWKYRFIR